MATFKPDYRQNYESLNEEEKQKQYGIEKSKYEMSDNIGL